MGNNGNELKNYLQLNTRGSFENKKGYDNNRSYEIALGINYTRIITHNFGFNIFEISTKGNSVLLVSPLEFFTKFHTIKYGGGISYRIYLNRTHTIQNIVNVNYFSSGYKTDFHDFLSSNFTCRSRGVQVDLKTLVNLYKKMYGTFSIQLEQYKSDWERSDIYVGDKYKWTQNTRAFFTNIGITIII